MSLPDRNPENLPDPDGDEYTRELTERLPEILRRTSQMRPEEIGSGEWFNAVAQFWGEARRKKGIPIRDAAERSGLPLIFLRHVEGRSALLDEVNGDKLPSYARNTLGDPGLYDEFTRQFQNPNWHLGRDLRRDRGFMKHP